MPISPYVQTLRSHLGSERLLLASVTALVRDDTGGLLLVRQMDGGAWATPGGAIEPDETPADAVVRETWEETGLLVEPLRVAAVLGGPEFVVRYDNGDETQYVMIVFDCAVRSGAVRADGDETVEVRFWRADEAADLPLTPWLRHVLPAFYASASSAVFEPPSWRPPAG